MFFLRPMQDWKRSFYAILVAETVATIGFNTGVPILPFFIRDVGVRDPAQLKVWVGASATLYSVSMFLLAPVWGQLADSRGRRLMFLRALACGMVVTAATGAANRPWEILVLRALLGALTGTVSAAAVMVSTISPRERLGFTLGMLQTGIYAGASLGPALGGFLSDLVGYRRTYYISAFLVLIAVLIVARFVDRDTPSGARSCKSSEGSSRSTSTSVLSISALSRAGST